MPDGAAAIGAEGAGDDLDSLGGYELRHYAELAAAFRSTIEGTTLATPVPLPVFADGLAVMRCMDAMRASSAAGGALLTIEGG